jgi:hypothetical protein
VLYVHNFIYRGPEALDLDRYYNAEPKPTAGFVIEMGDESEYGSFEAFREHIAAARLAVAWNSEAAVSEITYSSAPDTLDMRFRPGVKREWNLPSEGQVLERRVNGAWPYLPQGTQRDTPWSVQGSTGRLEKNGAILESEPGYRTYLLSEPAGGVVTAYNPVPDPLFLRLTTPDGVTVRADGRLGLARIEVHPGGQRILIDHQLKPEQAARADMAAAVVIGGVQEEPEILLNGTPLACRKTKAGDNDVYVCALRGKVRPRDALSRLQESDTMWAQVAGSAALSTYFHDWSVVGPFPVGSYAQHFFHLKDFGPEADGFRPAATYRGLAPGEQEPVEVDVRWGPAIGDGEPPLSAAPVDLNALFEPRQAVMAYAAASIVSETDRVVQLLVGTDERVAVWVNGERVIFSRGHRVCYRDQDRAFVTLRKGENPVLIKLSHGYEAWRLYFRLADEWGLPLAEGVHYLGAHGPQPAG